MSNVGKRCRTCNRPTCIEKIKNECAKNVGKKVWGKFGEVSAKKCEEVLPELQLVPGVPGRSIVPHQNHTIYHTTPQPYHTIPHP